MPAYWWMYNMYALARNTWKFTTRDKRKTKTQHIEFDSLAPDTVEEIFAALGLLERWTGKAALRAKGRSADKTIRPGGGRPGPGAADTAAGRDRRPGDPG